MTLSTVPDLLMGPAPPVDVVPGRAGTATGKHKQSTAPSAPSAFATLLQAVTGEQGGGETASPTGGTPLLSETDTSTTKLLAGLAGLVAGLTSEAEATETTDQIEMHSLLDRLAEVGTTTEDGLADLPAVEALMAYLLMTQPARTEVAEMPSLPNDVLALLQAGTPETLGGITSAGIASVRTDGDTPIDVPTFIAVTGAMAEIPTDAVPSEGAGALATAAMAATSDVQLRDDTDAGSLPVDLDVAMPVASSGGESTTAMPPVAVTSGSETGAQSESQSLREVLDIQADADADDQGEKPELMSEGMAEVATSQNPTAPAVEAVEPSMMPVPGTARPSTVAPPETVVASRPVNSVTLPGEIADTVRMAAFRGDSEVRLVLNPPDLGHLDIRIASGDGGLRVILEASQGDTHDLIDRSLVQLKQALEAKDVRVDRIEVRAADGGRSSMDASGQQSQNRGQSFGDNGRPDWSPIAAFDGGSVEASVVSSTSTTPTVDGRVDVLA